MSSVVQMDREFRANTQEMRTSGDGGIRATAQGIRMHVESQSRTSQGMGT